MEKPERLRIGVLGVGFFATLAHIPLLLATGEVALTALCRRDPDQLARIGALFGLDRRYTDYRQMLEEAPLDALVVSSPHGLHYEHTRAALERGLPVLTDKPLAVRPADAEELRDLAASKGLPLLVAAAPPYQADQRYLRARIAAGDLGEIHLVQQCGLSNVAGLFGRGSLPTTFPFPTPVVPTDFRAQPDLGGGGNFQDVGSHAVAGILAATGLPVTEVVASFDEATLDLRPAVVLRFANGAVATVAEVADAFPGDDTYRSLGATFYVGSKASFRTDGPTGAPLFQSVGGAPEEVPATALPASSSPAQNFVGVLRGREEPLLPVDIAVDMVRVVDAAYRSARERQPVRL